jgi:hypothetical protein
MQHVRLIGSIHSSHQNGYDGRKNASSQVISANLTSDQILYKVDSLTTFNCKNNPYSLALIWKNSQTQAIQSKHKVGMAPK